MKNAEEVEWWMGDIFTLLCENKEIFDPEIYNKIVDLKNCIINNKSTFLFFHTVFKNKKTLEEKFEELIKRVDTRVADLKLYIRSIKITEKGLKTKQEADLGQK